MQPRREPLLWLQCLAIGVIPLELLLIRLLLAGADPGPVPPLERLLLWAVAVLAPAVALWRRPADWGSLLLVRVPLTARTKEQQQLSGPQGGLTSRLVLLVITIGLLPLIWWMDESAGLVQELSPVQDRSRLVTLLLSTPLLALIVWQVQQLVQAILLLASGDRSDEPTEPLDAERIKSERSSFGLPLLRLQPLNWPEPAAAPEPAAEPELASSTKPTPTPEPTQAPEPILNSETDPSPDQEPPPAEEAVIAANETEVTDDLNEGDSHEGDSDEGDPDEDGLNEIENDPDEGDPDEDLSAEEATGEKVGEIESELEISSDQPDEGIDAALEDPESDFTVAAAVAVEPEQSGEEHESTTLDAEVVEGDAVAGGEAEEHGEHPQAGGGEERDPDQTAETTPGGL